MTYRELIAICDKTPTNECMNCKYKKECEAFGYETNVPYPSIFYEAFHYEIDLDEEIEV